MTLERCECRGRNYYGMPTFDIETKYPNDDEPYYFSFMPSQFEMFPKVDSITRSTYCNLSLWNLQDSYPEPKHDSQHLHNWSVG